MNHRYLPVEVKWTEDPSEKDCRHLEKFMQEYPCEKIAYLVCRIARPRKISDRVLALPWQELAELSSIINKE